MGSCEVYCSQNFVVVEKMNTLRMPIEMAEAIEDSRKCPNGGLITQSDHGCWELSNIRSDGCLAPAGLFIVFAREGSHTTLH